METDTVRDVLHWSTRFHTTLAQSLQKSKAGAMGERERLLMNYLSEHEQFLADNYQRYQRDAEIKVLNTWSYDCSKAFPKTWLQQGQAPFGDMTSQQIMENIEAQHNALIDFYQHLKRQAHITEVVAVLDQLIEMEQSEASVMNEASNRLEDL